MIKAEIRIALKNPKTVLDAIKPDLENTERFKADISAGKEELHIKIDAKDITAARAAINSYLRLIGTVKDVDEVQ